MKRKPEREEERKKLILEGCFKLFLKKNISSITVDDLEKSIGMGRGNIFYYFKDKEELFRATTELYLDKVLEYFIFFYQKDKKTLLQFIHDYVDNWKNFDASIKDVTQDDVASVLNFFFHAVNYYPEFETRMRRLFSEEQKCWEEIIRLAITQKEIKDIDVELTAERFQFIYMGVALQSYLLSYSKKMSLLLAHMMNLYEDVKYTHPAQKIF